MKSAGSYVITGEGFFSFLVSVISRNTENYMKLLSFFATCIQPKHCIQWSPNSPNVFITVTSEWAWWRLKSPASRLFTEQVIQVEIKENIKVPRHWPFVRGSHKWPVTRKMFPFDDVIMEICWQTNPLCGLNSLQLLMKLQWHQYSTSCQYWQIHCSYILQLHT